MSIIPDKERGNYLAAYRAALASLPDNERADWQRMINDLEKSHIKGLGTETALEICGAIAVYVAKKMAEREARI